MAIYLQVILVLLILVAMLTLLLGMHQLFHGHTDRQKEDLVLLRREVEHDSDVITEGNMFHDLVAGDNLDPEHFLHSEKLEMEYVRTRESDRRHHR